jgi:aspartyl/asparaginyl beta-hydroxylase (cupin superfamily)
VGDERRTWREGKVIVIDDAFEHEVWNGAGSDRVVLIVDVRAPPSAPPSPAEPRGAAAAAGHSLAP